MAAVGGVLGGVRWGGLSSADSSGTDLLSEISKIITRAVFEFLIFLIFSSNVSIFVDFRFK